MKIDDKVDAVYIPDSPSRIKANDYNQIKNEIQECITESGLTPTKDVIQLPQALKILTAQSGAEEVAKIEAAGQEQLNAINTAGGQAVQDAQTAASTATNKATEAASSATNAQNYAAQAQQSAQGAASSAEASSSSASAAQTSETAAQGYSANADAKAAQAQNYAQAAQTSAADALSSAQDAAQSAQNSRGLAVGTVYYSQSSLATDNPGGLPLFTGETITSANTIYPEFYNWVTAHTELQCTSAEYEAALTTYGECAKYVIGSGSLRLPLIKNYIKAANPSEGIKNIEAGLPDISFPMYGEGGAINNHLADGGDSTTGKTWSASAFNQIYGASDTVTPASTTLYPWVVAYAAAIPASTAQAAEFQQGLSGKADTNLGNIPSNYDYVVESYKDDQGHWYRKYKSGWLEQGGIVTAAGEVTLLKPFANTAYSVQATSLYTNYTNWGFGINKNSVSSFYLNMNTGTQGAMWEAKGQGAN